MNPAALTPTSLFSLQTEFARALSPRPGLNNVRIIGSNNELVQLVGWSAEAARWPYAVPLGSGRRYHAIAFDLDAKHGTENVERDLAVIHRLLDAAGARYATAVSGPTGGRHVLATLAARGVHEGQVEELARRLKGLGLKSLDITCLCNAATGSIRPPGSPHRTSGYSVPLDPDADLAALRSPNNPEVFLALKDCLPLRSPVLAPLQPPNGRKVLVNENRSGRNQAAQVPLRGRDVRGRDSGQPRRESGRLPGGSVQPSPVRAG